MVHRCDLVLLSDEPTGRDPYGRPIYGETRNSNVPCRLDQIRERVAADDTGNDVILTNVLILGPALQPTSNMTVENIRDEEGRTVVPGTFRVITIHAAYSMRRLHHYELSLTKESAENG